jgi:hypothetical protein
MALLHDTGYNDANLGRYTKVRPVIETAFDRRSQAIAVRYCNLDGGIVLLVLNTSLHLDRRAVQDLRRPSCLPLSSRRGFFFGEYPYAAWRLCNIIISNQCYDGLVSHDMLHRSWKILEFGFGS